MITYGSIEPEGMLHLVGRDVVKMLDAFKALTHMPKLSNTFLRVLEYRPWSLKSRPPICQKRIEISRISRENPITRLYIVKSKYEIV